MHEVTMTSYLCFIRENAYMLKRVLVFELSGPKSVSIPHFSSISLQKTDFLPFLWSQILQGTLCNFVAMVTAQNVTNWYDV